MVFQSFSVFIPLPTFFHFTFLIMNNDKNKQLERFARFGLAAKGAVYCLVGGLAVAAAFGAGGKTTGKKGAFSFVLEQPFGKVMLGIIAVGLLGYVAWRMIQAFQDPDHPNEHDTKNTLKRIGYGISGIAYGFLAYYALSLVFGWGSSSSGSGGESKREFFVAKLLEQPFGQWLVGIVAAFFIGKGLHQIYKAVSGKFKKHLKSIGMGQKGLEAVDKIGKVGYIARGIVLGIIGYLFIKAALQANPSKADGTSGAFDFIQNSTSGPWLLGLIAAGLFCYGVFMFVMARYRRVNPNV